MKKFLFMMLSAGIISLPSLADDVNNTKNEAKQVKQEVKEEKQENNLEQQIEKLAKEYGCSGCHAVDKVVAGPPYRVIAKEYKDKPNAKETLVKSVLGGSMMKWQAKAKKYGIKIKMAYMPAQHGVDKEKAEKIIELILKLDTDK